MAREREAAESVERGDADEAAILIQSAWRKKQAQQELVRLRQAQAEAAASQVSHAIEVVSALRHGMQLSIQLTYCMHMHDSWCCISCRLEGSHRLFCAMCNRGAGVLMSMQTCMPIACGVTHNIVGSVHHMLHKSINTLPTADCCSDHLPHPNEQYVNYVLQVVLGI